MPNTAKAADENEGRYVISNVANPNAPGETSTVDGDILKLPSE